MRTDKEYKELVERRLDELLKVSEEQFPKRERPRLLTESMRYSVNAGGKRLRACLLLAACEMLGGDIEEALDFACAIEMIHTYSLIHDDLPGMDNDVLRRGKPTNHVVYGVGQAILAGDGLLNYAFETMLDCALKADGRKQHNLISAMAVIAGAAGVKGMIAGQVADLYAEKREDVGEELLTYIHEGKTMNMIRGAILAGACIAGADQKAYEALASFGYSFGILFQVTDDILDVTADDQFGKSKGKDAEEGKLTAVSVYGLDGARALAEKLKDDALHALDAFGPEADYFRERLIRMYDRKH